MTPERMAGLVVRWARFYTRDLPAHVAERRVAEIAADLHDHVAHERAAGTGERRIALGVASRMARGVVADAAWRRRARERPATSGGAALHRSLIRVTLVVAVILSLPLAATLFTDGAAWSPTDFVIAAVLLGGTGLALELLVRKARDHTYRAAVGLALGAALLLVWIDLAVGVIGEPGEPANALYLVVLAVGIASTAAARLRPEPMARALVATALAQAAVAVIALLAGKADVPGSSVAELVLLNGLFVALFLGSACLFRLAARQLPPSGAHR
jgi:hypothetical protein